jgi:hypothetical protein
MIEMRSDISEREPPSSSWLNISPSRPEDDPTSHPIFSEQHSCRLDITLLEVGNREESPEIVMDIGVFSIFFYFHDTPSFRMKNIIKICLRMRAIIVIVFKDF